MFNQKQLEQMWNNFKQTATVLNLSNLKPTEFTGYANTESKSNIIALFNLRGEKINTLKGIGFMICDQTCFYARAGGQVSDTDTLTFGGKSGEIIDLRKTIVKGYYINLVNSNEIELNINDPIILKINEQKRIKISRNHSAIHIFYNMIEKVIGQKLIEIFNYVDEQKFYFETKINDKVNLQTLQLAINEANKIVALNLTAKIYYLTQNEAEKLGLSTSIYKEFAPGEMIRVVEYQNFSVELCGGTHAKSIIEFEQFFLLDFEKLNDKLRITTTVT